MDSTNSCDYIISDSNRDNIYTFQSHKQKKNEHKLVSM